MIDQTLARTPIHDRKAPAGLAVDIVAEAPRGMITLRGDLSSAAIADALQSASGLEIPAQRKFLSGGETSVFWMAPDEVMIQCAYLDAPAKTQTLADALAGEHHLAVNVSDMRQVFTLTARDHPGGPREVIAKGAPVDLHAEAFGVGDLRRTRIGTVASAFYQTSDAPETFEVFCFRSYAPYLFDWLCASAKSGSLPNAL